MNDELKKADEVVRALRDYASDCDSDSEYCFQCTFACVCDKFDNNAPKIIADLIESLTEQLASVTAERDALKERTTDAWLQLRTATFSTDKGAADLANFILSYLPEAPKEANNDESGN